MCKYKNQKQITINLMSSSYSKMEDDRNIISSDFVGATPLSNYV